MRWAFLQPDLPNESPQVEPRAVDQLLLIPEGVPLGHVPVEVAKGEVQGCEPHAAQIDIGPVKFPVRVELGDGEEHAA